MQDRLQELQKNILVIARSVCFLILCFVTYLNTQKIMILEEQIEELKMRYELLKRVDDANVNNNNNNNNNFLPDPTRIKRDAISHYVRNPDSYISNEFDTESPEDEDRAVLTKKPRKKMIILDEKHPRSGRIKPLPSVHFNGDTSGYIYGTHQNFNGNGHLRHTQRIFVDWKPSNWVDSTNMMQHFEYDDGYLTIKEAGLYLVYAQIYYLDEHDVNGYRVFKNNDMILQCTIQLNSAQRAQHGNTCYTAGIEYFAEFDKISLGDILRNHYSLFEAGKSFFGVVKLGDIKI